VAEIDRREQIEAEVASLERQFEAGELGEAALAQGLRALAEERVALEAAQTPLDPEQVLQELREAAPRVHTGAAGDPPLRGPSPGSPLERLLTPGRLAAVHRALEGAERILHALRVGVAAYRAARGDRE
jgi:hypothetical protein